MIRCEKFPPFACLHVCVCMYVMYADGTVAAPRGGGVVGSRNNNMSEQQKMSLMVIKERDAKIVSPIEPPPVAN